MTTVPSEQRCDWRVNQRCQHILGHDGPHMVMPLKPFDFMAADGTPYPALAEARADALDVDVVERLRNVLERALNAGIVTATEWDSLDAILAERRS